VTWHADPVERADHVWPLDIVGLRILFSPKKNKNHILYTWLDSAWNGEHTMKKSPSTDRSEWRKVRRSPKTTKDENSLENDFLCAIFESNHLEIITKRMEKTESENANPKPRKKEKSF